QRGLHVGNQVQPAEFRGLISLIDRQRLADLANRRNSVGVTGSDARQEQHIAAQTPRHIIADRLRRRRQSEAQSGEVLSRAHVLSPFRRLRPPGISGWDNASVLSIPLLQPPWQWMKVC